MTHQDLTLDMIDRSNNKIRWDIFDKILIGLSIIGLIILFFRLISGLLIFVPTFLLTFGFLFMLLTKKVFLDYHNYDIGLSKVTLKATEIQISSNIPDNNRLINLQNIKYLSIKYTGFDEGPRHIIWAPKAKRGNRNIISIMDDSGFYFIAEFYLKNKRQAIVLKNNLQYYRDLGVKDKEN